ncbi:hypothetical protein C8R45DRAFT_636241 [Mycena sanguinolenta]|nr:hypothetical protein C8R45DRAFT_636241 [Mycena sanguinolenta]
MKSGLSLRSTATMSPIFVQVDLKHFVCRRMAALAVAIHWAHFTSLDQVQLRIPSLRVLSDIHRCVTIPRFSPGTYPTPWRLSSILRLGTTAEFRVCAFTNDSLQILAWRGTRHAYSSSCCPASAPRCMHVRCVGAAFHRRPPVPRALPRHPHRRRGHRGDGIVSSYYHPDDRVKRKGKGGKHRLLTSRRAPRQFAHYRAYPSLCPYSKCCRADASALF